MYEYELVIIWATGEKEIYVYETEEKAEQAGKGMRTALGEQIEWWCVRRKYR